MSILENGVPSDEYLGLPIYENTLIQRWPQHKEYEFKDISYSSEGVAVYHGWLPLYSIALALKLGGIEPDKATPGAQTFRTSLDDARLRTLLPRLPPLFFSAIFLVFLFLGARRLGGNPMAWSALMLAAFPTVYIEFGHQARYYSATLALIAMAVWSLMRVLQDKRIRDWLLHGFILGLLFHTHVLSCVIACLMTGILGMGHLTQRRGIIGVAACVSLLGIISLPWMYYTDYFSMISMPIPKAYEFMNSPAEWLTFSNHRSSTYALVFSWLVLTIAMWLNRHRFSSSHRTMIIKAILYSVIIIFWAALIFLAFTLLMPLGSYWPQRIWLVLGVPKILFLALIIALIATLFSRRYAIQMAVVISLLTLVARGNLDMWPEKTTNYAHP
ncbi:MAG: putative membrane protein YiaA [Parasphingorhabdus sp.]